MAEKTTFASTPSCQTCLFFDSSTNLIQGKTTHYCRLKPPVVSAIAGMTPQGPALMSATFWPEVHASDWCGEHRKALDL